MSRSRAAAALAVILLLLPSGASRAQQQSAPGTAALTISAPTGEPVAIGMDVLGRLPAQKMTASFISGQGQRTATYVGPLLWDVLEQAKAIDPAVHQSQVSHFVVLTGRDGYRAVLALAELAPEFEGKQIILAQQMDGNPLGNEHLRVVVPADKRGGRSVRDIVRIEVKNLPPP
jgi:DMSO/TMAO reductase YedYZ molybdopterin-dependent catalytic subunit